MAMSSSTSHHPSGLTQLLQSSDATPLSRIFYPDMARTSHTPPASSDASPARSAKAMAADFAPDDRSAPSRTVSDETIADAYATFILYCNPAFSTSIDTTELVKLFRSPPRSDGNSFSTWALFELIRKFDAKEIKTWTQLALDLGVKSPDPNRGQSTQKVQQYSVRLKRWMRAMHIDAFFEYLLGRQHSYYMHIPPPHNPFPHDGRDGVPLEEDLAIRALDPSLRPKRGRRRAEDGDEETDLDESTPACKRPPPDTPLSFGDAIQPPPAFPTSAHPDQISSFPTPQDRWTTTSTGRAPSSAMAAASAPARFSSKALSPFPASPMSAQQFRWRLNTSNDPQTPHPLSAVTSQSPYPFFDDLQSVLSPSQIKPNKRRRHGPAVSSAWSGNNTSSSGKLRGRPPHNRSIRDGPFVTFPANPKLREESALDLNSAALTPLIEHAPTIENVFPFPPSTLEGPLPAGSQRKRLSLQVPQIIGNPVRLITPTVLVNGEENTSPSALSTPLAATANMEHEPLSIHVTSQGTMAPSETPAQPRLSPQQRVLTTSVPSLPPVLAETLNRVLAAELLRAPFVGRRKRLRGSEAKTLASAILRPLYASSSSTPGALEKAMHDDTLSATISRCIGLAGAIGIGVGGSNGSITKVECVRFRVGDDGYESPMEEEEEMVVEEDADGLPCHRTIKETFNVFFNVAFGGLTGQWMAKGLVSSLGDGEDRSDTPLLGSTSDLDNQDANLYTPTAWKMKFLEAQRQLLKCQEEVKSLKDRILDTVLY